MLSNLNKKGDTAYRQVNRYLLTRQSTPHLPASLDRVYGSAQAIIPLSILPTDRSNRMNCFALRSKRNLEQEVKGAYN